MLQSFSLVLILIFCGYPFCLFLRFSIRFWNSYDRVAFFVFHYLELCQKTNGFKPPFPQHPSPQESATQTKEQKKQWSSKYRSFLASCISKDKVIRICLTWSNMMCQLTELYFELTYTDTWSKEWSIFRRSLSFLFFCLCYGILGKGCKMNSSF
jgi:hypothetical protein